MPKLSNVSIALAAAMLSTSAALAGGAADDRSYLPPQNLQGQAKESKAMPQAERRIRSTHYTTARHKGHGPSFRGILRAIFH
jgi:hypothetical protein